jgi:hypothetical protein
METVIHVALEVAGSMKPRASANEDVPIKPFWPVVSSGSTGVGSDVIVTIRTVRGHADVDADLSLCCGSGGDEADSSHSGHHEKCESAHKFTS